MVLTLMLNGVKAQSTIAHNRIGDAVLKTFPGKLNNFMIRSDMIAVWIVLI